jgi:hypothetical protein
VCLDTSFEPKIAPNPPDSLTHVCHLSHLSHNNLWMEKFFEENFFLIKSLHQDAFHLWPTGSVRPHFYFICLFIVYIKPHKKCLRNTFWPIMDPPTPDALTLFAFSLTLCHYIYKSEKVSHDTSFEHQMDAPPPDFLTHQVV